MKKMIRTIVALVSVFLVCVACGHKEGQTSGQQGSEEASVPAVKQEKQLSIVSEPAKSDQTEDSTEPTPMLPDLVNPEGGTLQERIRTPQGYNRIEQEEGSFGAFVRNLGMLPDGSPVLLWDGTKKGNQSAQAAVFEMPVLAEMDVQQCADSVMRVYAEYFWSTGQYDKIKFHFVDGFLFDYPTFREGNRVKFNNDKAYWQKSAGYDDSYQTFEERYLLLTFAYSSTLSMGEESVPADIQDIRIGDVFLKSGSPGHVVMVSDICQDAQGRKAFLLAQGYMPAQQFHVLWNPQSEGDPWYYVEDQSYPFQTPEYTFGEGSFRRLRYLD